MLRHTIRTTVPAAPQCQPRAALRKFPRRVTRSGGAWPALPARRALLAATASSAALLLAACGSSGGSSPRPSEPSSSQPSGTTSAASTGGTGDATYQLHMAFFSAESKITPVIDPQVFVAEAGAKAAVGPQMISHVAGVAPAKQAGSPTSPLLAADGTPLKITLGQWEKAAGTVAFSCVNGKESAASTLAGLIPSATYSAFVVHLNVQGAGRFTPWGDAAGTTNNFTASSAGTAFPTHSVTGCLGTDSAAVIIWHSDGKTHGPTPGTLGVTWHNSLITPLP